MFLIFQDLVAPSADRRETLPLDLYLTDFYNASPKLLSPKKLGPKMQNLVRFYATSDFGSEYLWNESRYPKSEKYMI